MTSTASFAPKECPKCNTKLCILDFLIPGRCHHPSCCSGPMLLPDWSSSTQLPCTTHVLEKDIGGHCIRPKRERCPGKKSRWASIVNRLRTWTDAPKYRLTSLATTATSRTYTVQIHDQTHVVKLCNGNRAEHELLAQARVYNHMKLRWGLVRRCLQQPALLAPRVPRPGARVVRRRCFGALYSAEGFMMQYIPPIHPQQRSMLIQKYLDPCVWNGAMEGSGYREMRFKIRMGELTPEQNERSGQLQDRPVFFDQLWRESQELLPAWAIMMGGTLAILHWSCGLDARGVEFTLGFHTDRNHLWISEFGDCSLVGEFQPGVEMSMIDAVMENPSWPRPPTAPSLGGIKDPHKVLQRTWQRFRDAYLATSAEILFESNAFVRTRRLPGILICKLESMWKTEADAPRPSDSVSSLYMNPQIDPDEEKCG